MRFFIRTIIILLGILLVANASAQNAPRKPAVLFVGAPHLINTSGVPARLERDFGIHSTVMDFGGVNFEAIRKFNVVVFFDFSHLNPNSECKTVNYNEIGQEGFDLMKEQLQAFLNEGGGIYLFGCSFVHMGDAASTDALNAYLKSFDAQVLFEEIRDEAQEKRQPDGLEITYARAAKLNVHPVLQGIKNYWYPVGRFSYGPWTRPLQIGKDWTPLIGTSDMMKAQPVNPRKGVGNPYTGAPSAVKEKYAVICAARTVEAGRMILNGGESTISFFGYGPGYADEQWGRIGMEKGLDGKPGDGLKLLVNSLLWLAEPSLKSGSLGGYAPPPPPKPPEPAPPKPAPSKTETPKAEPTKPEKPKPPKIPPMRWDKPEKMEPCKYIKGIIGVVPAGAGGSGTIAEYVKETEGLGFMVVAGVFPQMNKAAWDKLVADCTAGTTYDCTVIPGLFFQDEQGNRFLQAGANAWAEPDRLSQKDPKRVQDLFNHWRFDCNFALRTPFSLSKGVCPPGLYRGYDTFAVRTYENGKLTDDPLAAYLQIQAEGNRCRPIAVNLLTSPANYANEREFTWLRAENRKEIGEMLARGQFGGGNIGFVSNGPRVDNWYLENGMRNSSAPYVPLSERWRAGLLVGSDTTLRLATIYDGTEIFRRIAISGNTAQLYIDGLHDRRHVLTAVIEDINGARAVTGSLETGDQQMAQSLGGDRAGMGWGSSLFRTPQGNLAGAPAMYSFGKGTPLAFGTVTSVEGIPGYEGGIRTSRFVVNPDFRMTAEGDQGEERSPVHQIIRPYESADVMIFDTPIVKRTATPMADLTDQKPYGDLAEPRVAARMTQYHFHRKPFYPSPAMAELSMTVTNPAGAQIKKGAEDFSIRYSTSTSPFIKKYAVVRADGTKEEGPSPDEKVGTTWRGRLKPGDFVFFPDQGEGMFLLDGELDVAIECAPSRKLFRMATGRFDTPKLAANTKVAVRILNLRTASAGDAALAEWTRFRDAFGIASGKPSCVITPTQGKVGNARYLLELAADNFGWDGTFGKADLPQEWPVQITGLNPKWTAAKVNNESREWFPLAVWNGAAYTTVDPREGDQRLYIGNLVTADQPEVSLTLIGDVRKKIPVTLVDVHNPTNKDLAVNVTVPVATFLAEKQTLKASVQRCSTTQIELKAPPPPPEPEEGDATRTK